MLLIIQESNKPNQYVIKRLYLTLETVTIGVKTIEHIQTILNSNNQLLRGSDLCLSLTSIYDDSK